jgi:hypothetical protein
MSDYATLVATHTFDLISTQFQAEFTTFRKTPMLQINKADLPIMGVYILREQRSADGDANVGVPKFLHHLTLGIAGAVSVESDAEGEFLGLEDTMTAIDEFLLRKKSWLDLIEGVVSMDRKSQYSKVGEVSLAEIRVEMVVQFRSQYEPVIEDDFLTMHVKTAYPTAATTDSEVLQVEAEFDIPQN